MTKEPAEGTRRWVRRSLGVVACLLVVGLAASCWVLNTKILLRDDYERGYDLGEARNKHHSFPFCPRVAAEEYRQDRNDDWQDWDEAAFAFAVGCMDAASGAPRDASQLAWKMRDLVTGGDGGGLDWLS